MLLPVEVDPATGYRSYTASQLPRLYRILALNGLGFSLEHIGTVLDEGLTAEQMRGMLRLRHDQISQQLVEMRDQLVEVEARLYQIEREDMLSPYKAIVKPVEPQLVASVRAMLPNFRAVGMLFGEVYEATGSQVPEALGPHPGEGGQTLVVWYNTEFKEQDVDGAAAFLLRCRVPDRGRMRVHELPAAMMAATIHHGSYMTIGEADEAVIRWIAANGYRIAGPEREVYLYNQMPVRQDDPSYVTEIQYPIAKAANGSEKGEHP